jgi:GAF domain-containing protein
LLSIIVGLVIFTLATVIASLTEHRLQKDTQNLIAQSQLLSQQIEQHRTLLEKRVSERTRVLEASFNISRQIAGLVDRSEIVREVMKLVHETFNFYHIYIYLFDEQKEYLEAVGGIGEVGSLMAAQRHRIPRGAGLVGQAAQKNKTVRVLDVGSEPIWLAHKLLPETKSEVVVPIALGNDVLGVLGVQEREIAGISEEAASLLESIASQVAFSLQNAKNFQMTQQQIQHEALINHVSQQIRQTNDRQKAIQVAVRELGRALHVPQTIIQLQDRPPHVKKHSV